MSQTNWRPTVLPTSQLSKTRLQRSITSQDKSRSDCASYALPLITSVRRMRDQPDNSEGDSLHEVSLSKSSLTVLDDEVKSEVGYSARVPGTPDAIIDG